MSEDSGLESPEDFDIERLLMDEFFGELSESEESALREKLSQDENLVVRRNDIRNTMKALDTAAEVEPPTDLADRTLAWIDSVRQTNTLINLEQLGSGYRPTFALKELLAIAAMFIIAAGVIFSSLHVARVKDRQNICMSQLGEIGSAINQYAMANDHTLPSADQLSDTNWLSHGGANQPGNSSAMFRLLKQNYLSNPALFQCPAVGGKSFTVQNGMKDFPDRRHIHYSYQHALDGSNPRTDNSDTRMAVLSDQNPRFITGKYSDKHKISTNHGNGQAVLYITGRCEWTDKSNVGVDDDEIFIPGEIASQYTGRESPATQNDSFLVPN